MFKKLKNQYDTLVQSKAYLLARDYQREIFQPNFFKLVKDRKYDKKTFLSDLVSGLIVGIVAIPIGIAFAIASGCSPQQGLITAFIAGFIISLLGGTDYQIGGPTGAFILVISGILNLGYGMNGLIISTVLAGIMLVLMGVLKLGNIIKFIPYPIVVGFTSGIALVIFSSQIKDFLGLTISDNSSEFINQWGGYLGSLSTINWWAFAIGILTVLIIVFWPRVTKKIPGSLVAIIVLTVLIVLAKKYLGINIDTIGSKFPELTGGAPLPKPETPEIDMKAIRLFIQPAFTLAMLGAIESLLSAMVADGATGKKHHSNTELIAQGVANIASPIFGGIPAVGGLARTMTNVNNGGKTPVAGMIHAVLLLLVYLFLMPLAAHIPLACLAGILVMAAYNMSEWRSFKALMKSPRSDVAVLLVTFFLTIIFGLSIAIEIGIIMAILLFLKRVMETSDISILNDIRSAENDESADSEILNIPKGVEVYEINGPFFFGLANKFDEVDSMAKKEKIKVRVIRMRKVPFVDSTGLHNLQSLWKRSKKEKIQIVLSGVTPSVFETLKKSGFADELGEEFICDHISFAMEKATQLININTLQAKDAK